MGYNITTMIALKGEILEYLGDRKRIRPCQLKRRVCNVSRTAIQKVLKELIDEGLIAKSGKVPKVYYRAVRLKGSGEMQWRTKSSTQVQDLFRCGDVKLNKEDRLLIERLL